ncbi:MAG TPA: hypothetical protein VF624_18085 [Tepidisphaeraceae bacterium]|jgi:DNA-directed RNA polymerase specialized sigma24 family protein
MQRFQTLEDPSALFSLLIIARWLVRTALVPGEAATCAHRLFSDLLGSEQEAERLAAVDAIAWQGDLSTVTQWLAEQILASPRRTLPARACLKHCLVTDDAVTRQAAEDSLIWMILHTRPSNVLKSSQRKQLISNASAAGMNWATRTFAEHVVHDLLRGNIWARRCRVAKRGYGYDLEDEAVNHVWERIERYRREGGRLDAWLHRVLNNHWLTLQRKWARQRKRESDLDPERDAPESPATPAKTAKPALKPLSSTRALCSEDVAILKQWEPIDGMLLVTEFSLKDVVPADLMENWMKRLGIRSWDLNRSLWVLNAGARRQELARLTGIKANTLAQRWRRLKPRLTDLHLIRSRDAQSEITS